MNSDPKKQKKKDKKKKKKNNKNKRQKVENPLSWFCYKLYDFSGFLDKSVVCSADCGGLRVWHCKKAQRKEVEIMSPSQDWELG